MLTSATCLGTATRLMVAGAAVVFLSPGLAHAYLGPGLGLGAIGATLGVIGAVLLGLVSIIWYPLKKMFRRMKGSDKSPPAGGDPPS